MKHIRKNQIVCLNFFVGFLCSKNCVLFHLCLAHCSFIMLPYLSFWNRRKLCLLTQVMFSDSPVDNIVQAQVHARCSAFSVLHLWLLYIGTRTEINHRAPLIHLKNVFDIKAYNQCSSVYLELSSSSFRRNQLF